MKPLPLMLMNLALVAAALFVYDQLRGGADTSGTDATEASAGEWADLERRLAALEAERAPVLRAEGSDPHLLARLRALEAQVAAAPAGGPAPRRVERRPAHGTGTPAAPAPQVGAPSVSGAPDAPGAPSPEEIARFRRLRDAVAREDEVRRFTERVDRTARKLDLGLTPRQLGAIGGVLTDFQPRIGEIWSEAKSRAEAQMKAGGSVDRSRLYADTRARIQREFVEAIDGVLRGADAEALARGLLLSGR